MTNPGNSSFTATLLGMAAILIWSTSIAFTRSLLEQVGPMTAASAVYLGAGVVGLVFQALMRQRLSFSFHGLLPAYWLGGGACFVIYEFGFFTALGLTANAQQVMEVTLINYLWPGLTLALSVPILSRRATPWLVPGILLTLAGIAMGLLPQSEGQGYSFDLLWLNIRRHGFPYLLMLIAAVSWALHCNLSRRFGVNGGAIVPFFLLATGATMLPLRFLFHETTVWTTRAAWEYGFMTVGVAFLGNVFWNLAMRRGNITLVSLAAYFTPILAILFNGLYLRIGIGANLWIAGLLVVAGALLCKVSIRAPAG